MEQTTQPQTRRKTQPLEAAQVANALLERGTVEALTGLRRSTLYQRIADGNFPAPVRLGRRCSRWRAAEVNTWLDSQGAVA